ncbi:MAG: cation diffusion facilitator family transporter [Methanoregula sp.]|jgi:cobalt-zinc-cadmium efflux system protein
MVHTHRDFKKPLQLALVITTLFFIIELVGGLISGSLALVSDAGHVFSDVLALLLSLGAITLASRLPSKERTYGLLRAEIFAAFINSLLLMAVSAIILWEAWQRLLNPSPIQSGLMGAVAVTGLIANIAVAFLLHGSHNLNVKSAFLHVIGDAVSSVAVIVAAIWIAFTGQVFVDPLLSGFITVLIIASAAGILRETIALLLQFTPRSVDFDAVIADMTSVTGVSGVHQVHIWSLNSDIHVLDAHIYSCERDVTKIADMKREIKERLENYHIHHSTLEVECEECADCAIVEPVNGHTE